MKRLLLPLLLVAATMPVLAQICNGETWFDTQGHPVQAHGGNITAYAGRWWLIGEDRSGPWKPDVNLYSSTDMTTWSFEGKIIQNHVTHPELGVSRMIERPKLLHNQRTGKFIVWCHWEAFDYSASEVGVFEADTITGPYRMVWTGRPLGIKSRDCNVFIDTDSTAYFISTIEENRHLGLFRLSADWLHPEECTLLFAEQRREAPAIARVDSMYYMLSSACTGWDPNPCKVATSRHLTHGWSALQQVGDNTAFDTQPTQIISLPNSTHLYLGDRWKDPDLPSSKLLLFPLHLAPDSVTITPTTKLLPIPLK